MELRHLRYFVAVADALSFRRAAVTLNISQPPLSQQIRDLEYGLGTPLFVRERRSIRLTDAGHSFLRDAKIILSDADKAAARARSAAKGEIGELKINFMSSAVSGTLQSLAASFKAHYPRVALKLQQSDVETIMRDVTAERIDIGLVRTPVTLPAGLFAKQILRESYYVALPAIDPLRRKARITPADLRGLGLILYPRTTASGSYEDIVSLFKDQGFVPDIVQEAVEQLTIAGLVAAGMGYSIVPECMTRIKVPGVLHRPLVGGHLKTGIAVVFRRVQSSLVKNFLDCADKQKGE